MVVGAQSLNFFSPAASAAPLRYRRFRYGAVQDSGLRPDSEPTRTIRTAAKAAKAKVVRVMKAEERTKAMIALSEKRYKLLGEDTI
jgi:hypothetical protein